MLNNHSDFKKKAIFHQFLHNVYMYIYISEHDGHAKVRCFDAKWIFYHAEMRRLQ